LRNKPVIDPYFHFQFRDAALLASKFFRELADIFDEKNGKFKISNSFLAGLNSPSRNERKNVPRENFLLAYFAEAKINLFFEVKIHFD
jgi:hypothetical protein